MGGTRPTVQISTETLVWSIDMNDKYFPRPDTSAWIMQSWGFFAMATLAEVTAILWLPLAVTLKLLLVMILAATVYICFALAKTVRDNRDTTQDTQAWIIMTYGMAIGMVCALTYGMYFISPDWQQRVLLGMGLAWTIQSTLVLAKTIRDQKEAQDAAATMREAERATKIAATPPHLERRPATES